MLSLQTGQKKFGKNKNCTFHFSNYEHEVTLSLLKAIFSKPTDKAIILEKRDTLQQNVFNMRDWQDGRKVVPDTYILLCSHENLKGRT